MLLSSSVLEQQQKAVKTKAWAFKMKVRTLTISLKFDVVMSLVDIQAYPKYGASVFLCLAIFEI